MPQSQPTGAGPLTRSAVLSQLPIAPSDFVVEIGAGPVPFRLTSLIIDKYPFENLERHGDIINVAPTIKADATKLPIADQACDVLFASHVIEHIPEPWKFLQEAKRCARFIYLEFPSAWREVMYAWSFHRWLVEVEQGRLVFYKNDIPQLFGDLFHTHYDYLLDTWSEYRFAELNTYLYTKTAELACVVSSKTAFQHVLSRSAQGEKKLNFPSRYGQMGIGSVPYPLAARFKTLLWSMTPAALIKLRNRVAQRRNSANRPEFTEALLPRLLCQACRVARLSVECESTERIIACKACGARYRATDGVFDFDI